MAARPQTARKSSAPPRFNDGHLIQPNYPSSPPRDPDMNPDRRRHNLRGQSPDALTRALPERLDGMFMVFVMERDWTGVGHGNKLRHIVRMDTVTKVRPPFQRQICYAGRALDLAGGRMECEPDRQLSPSTPVILCGRLTSLIIIALVHSSFGRPSTSAVWFSSRLALRRNIRG